MNQVRSLIGHLIRSLNQIRLDVKELERNFNGLRKVQIDEQWDRIGDIWYEEMTTTIPNLATSIQRLHQREGHLISPIVNVFGEIIPLVRIQNDLFDIDDSELMNWEGLYDSHDPDHDDEAYLTEADSYEGSIMYTTVNLIILEDRLRLILFYLDQL